jgi:hypothetical protein
LNNVIQVIGVATASDTILLDIGAVTRLTEFSGMASIFNAGDSFVITHDADPDYIRFVQTIMQREDIIDVVYSPSTASKFDYDPTQIEFGNLDDEFAWCQMTSISNLPDMVVNYLFENDTIHDYTEKGNNGVQHGGSYGDGIVNKAFVLDGTSAYIDIPNVSDLRISDPATKSITFEFWLNTSTGTGEIINLWNEADNRRSWRLYVDGGWMYMDFSMDGETVGATISNIVASSINPGWNHIGVQLNNDNTVTIAIYDNSNDYSYTITSGFAFPLFENTVDAIRIGAKGGATPSNYLTGSIAEFAIYRNVDLTLPSGDYDSQLIADMHKNLSGQHLGRYATGTLASVKTNASGRIDTSNWLSIFGINVDWNNWSPANLYALLSVDGGTTWLKWNGSTWDTVAETEQGTLVSDFPTDKAYWDEMFVPGTLDILLQLNTNDATQTASVYNVFISTLQQGYQNVDTSKIIYNLISPTQTKVMNITNLYGQNPTRYYNVKGKVSL